VRGDVVEVFPAGATDRAVRCEWFGDEIDRISEFDPFTGEITGTMNHIAIYPASHYVVADEKRIEALTSIEAELEVRLKEMRATWASCWKPSGWSSGPATTWRCSGKSGSAPASKTTAAT
jgi:excinuclease UvrABC helicase subunit UvrB